MPRNKTIREEEIEEAVVEDVVGPLSIDKEDEDDPLSDFMPEEENW
ncbi:MAG: hypothetical protein AAB484_02120 [Patescibacteria group bacterium]